MKKFLLAIGLVLCMAGVSSADPMGFYDKTKELVDKMEPRGGAFYSIKAHEWMGYTAAKVFSKEFKGYSADATIGYAVDHTLLLGAETDILATFATITGAALQIPWLEFHAGYNVGFSFEDDHVAHGPSLNASVKW